MAEKDILLVVAGALVRPDGQVLLQRRPPGKAHAALWEFPGGKVEPGEVPEAALIRELAEELGIVVEPGTAVPIAFAEAGDAARPIVLLLYAIDRWLGTPRPIEASAIDWVDPSAMASRAMPPADYPLAAALATHLAAHRAG